MKSVKRAAIGDQDWGIAGDHGNSAAPIAVKLRCGPLIGTKRAVGVVVIEVLGESGAIGEADEFEL